MGSGWGVGGGGRYQGPRGAVLRRGGLTQDYGLDVTVGQRVGKWVELEFWRATQDFAARSYPKSRAAPFASTNKKMRLPPPRRGQGDKKRREKALGVKVPGRITHLTKFARARSVQGEGGLRRRPSI